MPSKDNILGTYENYPKQWKIVFDLKITSASGGNIIHATTGTDDWNDDLGSRTPALFLDANTKKVWRVLLLGPYFTRNIVFC